MGEINKRRSKNVIAAVAMIAIAVIIFRFSAQTGAESLGLSERVRQWLQGTPLTWLTPMITNSMASSMRKWAHIYLYAALGFFSYLAVGIYAPGVCFLYSCADEFHQRFVPGRSGRVRDLGYDACGWAAGVAAAAILLHLYRRLAACYCQYKYTSRGRNGENSRGCGQGGSVSCGEGQSGEKCLGYGPSPKDSKPDQAANFEDRI